MKALVYHRFGNADVMNIEEIVSPPIPDNGVLIAMRASTVNVIDYLARNGVMAPMVNKKFPKIPGADVAGIVTEVGKNATHLKVGDAVFGFGSAFKGGSIAEQVALPESVLTKKPEALGFNEAAALPVTGLAALLALRDLGNVKQGDQVLIYGSSGAAGLFAVQLGKIMGAHVTAVCGTDGVATTQSMGADAVVDYKSGTVKFDRLFDIIIDFSNHFAFGKARMYLKPKGRFIDASPNIPKFIGSMLKNPFRSQKELMLQTTSRPKDLDYLALLATSGKLKITIAKIYPLAEAKQAFIEMETKGAIGKIVITNSTT